MENELKRALVRAAEAVEAREYKDEIKALKENLEKRTQELNQLEHAHEKLDEESDEMRSEIKALKSRTG